MRLLLPADAVLSFQNWMEEPSDDHLSRAWLYVADPVFLTDWSFLGSRRRAGDRYLKQCFVSDDPPRWPLVNVNHYRLGCLHKTIPKREMLCRLEDEQDAFLRTLRNYPLRT